MRNWIAGFLIITSSGFLFGCAAEDGDSQGSLGGNEASFFTGDYVLVSLGKCSESAEELAKRDTLSSEILKITTSKVSEKYHVSDSCDIFKEAAIIKRMSSSLELQGTTYRAQGSGCESLGLKDGSEVAADEKLTLRLRQLEAYLMVTEPEDFGGDCSVWKRSK